MEDAGGERRLAPQEGDVVVEGEEDCIRCPWHGWEFDLRTGQVVWHNLLVDQTGDLRRKGYEIFNATEAA